MDAPVTIPELGRRAKAASRQVALASTDVKNAALLAAADLLVNASGEILDANARDLERAEAGGATATQLEGSGFSQKRARSVLQIARELPRFEDALSGAQSDRHRFRLLRSMSPEMRTIVATEHPEQAAHLDRYEDFQRFKLALRGNDLEVPAGPHIARALERTREAVFTGEIQPEEARDFAKDLAVRYLKD